MATLNFNVNNNLKDNNGSDDSRYETVAPGWYHAVAIGSEMKTTGNTIATIASRTRGRIRRFLVLSSLDVAMT